MTKPRGPRRKPLDPARRAAFDVLRAVSERDAYANLVLPALLRERRITGRDAAFATELTYGACRTRGLLDAVIADWPPDVRRTASARSCSTCFGLAPTNCCAHTSTPTRRCPPPSSRRESNSIRRVPDSSTACCAPSSRREPQAWIDELAPPADSDPVGHMAFVHAHPRWIAQAFADALGARAGELDALLTADDDRPLVHLAARPGALTAEELASSVDGTVGRYSPYAVYLGGGDRVALDAVRDGVGARPGRGQPTGGAGAHARARRRRRRGDGWICARVRAARRRCWPRSARSRAPGWTAIEPNCATRRFRGTEHQRSARRGAARRRPRARYRAGAST